MPIVIGQPVTREYFKGIPVTLEQLVSAFYILAPAYGEQDYDAIAKLVERAKHELATGMETMPSLLMSFTSHHLTGSYVAARDKLNEEFRRSGYVLKHFQHNTTGRRMDNIFYNLEIEAGELSPGLYVLSIADQRIGRREDWNALIAEALGVERVLDRICISFPLEVVNGTRFRFDYEPFMEAMRELGMVPGEYCSLKGSSMTGKAAAERLMRIAASDSPYDPLLSLEYRKSPGFRGWEVTLAPYGCKFSEESKDPWVEPRTTVCCKQEGSVISGPLAPDPLDSDCFQDPTMVISIFWPNVVREGFPVAPVLATPELKQPVRDLAARIAAAVER